VIYAEPSLIQSEAILLFREQFAPCAKVDFCVKWSYYKHTTRIKYLTLAILAELEVFKRVNCYDSGRKSFFFRETRNSSILVLMTDVASISGRYSLGR
jgi:hypothetical protein